MSKNTLWDYFKAIVIAIVIALFFRAFVVQAFKIPSGSMEPDLIPGDHILVNKFIYGVHIPFTKAVIPVSHPETGQVIVFKFPYAKKYNLHPGIDFIKRVVGTPGDKVQIINNNVYVNNRLYVCKYAKWASKKLLPAYDSPRDNFGPITVPKGELFVMGDNRDNSLDSRYWGFVPYKDIIGQAFMIYFSWNPKNHFDIYYKRFFKMVPDCPFKYGEGKMQNG
ncbi:MAG: signal peptidase I [Candidatus Acidulodesulfobacterium ferriphilum]|uniref:Signal peptidase I n=1 Tax=Candidatus Acidulodesulfobacterium ferriphilum TaxID=2597223 RepID=A0A519B9C5_9DELT|nr:MAG: signal peptidase I [Candidatus Acidulodesulfobacterium ferriphilum]